ncbi:MAG: POTRA domain-containing protein [Cyanobacteria bacterium P01_G01_bin.54]
MGQISFIGLVAGSLLTHSVGGAWAATPTHDRVTLLELPPHLQQFIEQIPIVHDCPLDWAAAADHLLAHLPEPPMPAPTVPELTLRSHPQQPVTVKGLRFVGNQIYSDRQLYEQAIAPLAVHPPYTAEEIAAITTQITQLYQDNGYINTWTTIPNLPPDDKNRLTVVIVESGVEKIQLSYSQWGDPLDMMAICEHLAGVTQPLQIEQLEQALQQLERNPLIEAVQAELIPGNGPAGQILTVELIGASGE